MEKFEPGDIVQLKANGLKIKVTDLLPKDEGFFSGIVVENDGSSYKVGTHDNDWSIKSFRLLKRGPNVIDEIKLSLNELEQIV